MIPIGLASAVAAALRYRFAALGLIAPAPLFPVPPHAILNELGLLSALAVGIAGGLTAWLLTVAVYGAEDAFHRLPIHWVWWPAIGGLVVGIGGLIDPRALGVGYDTIGAELAGRIAVAGLVTLLVVKLVIWAVALGSGTSGGILAPLLMIGAAVGGLMAPFLPGGSPAIWGLIGMAAALAGVTRSPFTAVIFGFELTHDANALLPLLIASMAAHQISVLALKRSILTEKVARRGFHVTREYSVDPLEALFVRDVMATEVLTVEPERQIADLLAILKQGSAHRRQRLYPVIQPGGELVGLVAWSELLDAAEANPTGTVGEVARNSMVLAYADETLRSLADRMAARGVGVMPVVSHDAPGQLVGVVSQFDLLRARERLLQEERHRERVLRVRMVPGGQVRNQR